MVSQRKALLASQHGSMVLVVAAGNHGPIHGSQIFSGPSRRARETCLQCVSPADLVRLSLEELRKVLQANFEFCIEGRFGHDLQSPPIHVQVTMQSEEQDTGVTKKEKDMD